MPATASATLENRYDIVYLFDCLDGNPNGDPDSANSPRIDPETFQGLVSDVCLKRKIRDYVALLKTDAGTKPPEPGYEIFVMSGHSLESRQRLPFDKWKDEIHAEGKATTKTDVEKARGFMCRNFFDVRAFGAVMSTTEFNCGQVRGPVQMTFARSNDRIFATEHGISRVAYTKEQKTQEKGAVSTELGNKHTVAYGLYRAHIFVNAPFAAQTGFTDNDLDVLKKALNNMFDLDRSAARGTMSVRGIWAFKHASRLGEAPAQRLLERIKPQLKPGIEAPRRFEDYFVDVTREGIPKGVELQDWTVG